MEKWVDTLEKISHALRRNWHKSWALFALLAIISLALISLFKSITFDTITLVEWVIIGATLIIATAFWIVTNRVPRAKKGMLGFGLALTYENEDHARKLRSDFVLAIRNLLTSWHTTRQPQFIEFPSWIAEKLASSDQQAAGRIAQKANCEFFIWGQAKLRTDGTPIHVLKLQGLIKHSPIQDGTQRKFAAEFSELFPKDVRVTLEGDFAHFEVTATYINIVVRYIVAVAAGLSDNIHYSAELFRGLREQLKTIKIDGGPIATIRDRIPKRLGEVLKAQLKWDCRRYTQTRDKSVLVPLEQVAEELNILSPNLYDVRLIRSLCHFVLRRDIAAAREELNNCKQTVDSSWRWNLAFLSAYEGDLDSAYRLYCDAFEKTVSDGIPIEIEEFIQLVLDEEPEKVQLFYALGLINHKFKEDAESAKSDLRKFVDWAKKISRYPIQVEAAEKWLGESKGKRKSKQG